MNLYTIGHSNHDWESFSALQEHHAIELLVDVRSRPVSRFAPFSNRRRFPGLLDSIGIEYRFMGDSLGGRPEDPKLYDAEGKPDYLRMRSTQEFKDGLQQLSRMARELVTVIMCSEGDPVGCHRRLLIGAALVDYDVNILHVLRDGTLLSEEDLRRPQGKLAI